MPRHVVILGAGINGLMQAWSLKKRLGPEVTITCVEASSRVGGWVETLHVDGFLFEKGPRSLRPYTDLLQTLEALGLQDQIIFAHPQARQRYTYYQGALHPFPSSLSAILKSKIAWSALWHDFTALKGEQADETIYSFFARRIGLQATQEWIDPLVSGIYAGDIHQLSVKSCFPALYAWEQTQGSLLKGFLRSKKNTRKKGLFSFKKGLETLTKALYDQIDGDWYFNQQVEQLNPFSDHVQIKLQNGQILEAEEVISTLPAFALGKLLNIPALNTIPYATVAVVNLGYHDLQVKQTGFGYLIPSKEQTPILGCVWDSLVFPRDSTATSLTVMIGGTHHPYIQHTSTEILAHIAQEAVFTHMGIQQCPHTIHVKLAVNAIPQFEVGYAEHLTSIQQHVASLTSRLNVSGSFVRGVALHDCMRYHF